MGQNQTYSKEFRNAIITKILNRGEKSMLEICANEGVALGTGSRWVSMHSRLSDMKTPKSSKKWTAEEKLKVLIETGNLSVEELGIYIRKHGLYSQQLTDWKSEFISSMKTPTKSKIAKSDINSKKMIKSLEREINRKDKALAEASALLILQKKVNLIWGYKDEDEK
jgi:transposase